MPHAREHIVCRVAVRRSGVNSFRHPEHRAFAHAIGDEDRPARARSRGYAGEGAARALAVTPARSGDQARRDPRWVPFGEQRRVPSRERLRVRSPRVLPGSVHALAHRAPHVPERRRSARGRDDERRGVSGRAHDAPRRRRGGARCLARDRTDPGRLVAGRARRSERHRARHREQVRRSLAAAPTRGDHPPRGLRRVALDLVRLVFSRRKGTRPHRRRDVRRREGNRVLHGDRRDQRTGPNQGSGVRAVARLRLRRGSIPRRLSILTHARLCRPRDDAPRLPRLSARRRHEYLFAARDRRNDRARLLLGSLSGEHRYLA